MKTKKAKPANSFDEDDERFLREQTERIVAAARRYIDSREGKKPLIAVQFDYDELKRAVEGLF